LQWYQDSRTSQPQFYADYNVEIVWAMVGTNDFLLCGRNSNNNGRHEIFLSFRRERKRHAMTMVSHLLPRLIQSCNNIQMLFLYDSNWWSTLSLCSLWKSR
jgi:hypothetical protein